ncbi:type II toxin-antitoxin system HicA family toxin [Acaryochloris thomasi]|uniref:type II toxin-antitoxin system HicA family toxin n=1 Tax=Acaryochloris thomasi TaxID=2929456 RepID=UPI000DA66F1A|nr:type II toxin-antitoxin system HicA family toxin [Acaryochloris thomasi]
MNNKQKKTLRLIFTDPVPANLPWADIAKLFESLGASVTQGRGSRVRVLLNGQRAVFHEPHPQRVTDKGTIKSVREFLVNAGIEPESESEY